jgi:NusA-like KH domain protein
MSKIKFDIETIKIMSLFEAITRAKLKDCIINKEAGQITFVVEENEIGKAIGKNALNIKILEQKLNKRIKIVEFSKNIVQFARNLAYPLRLGDITFENSIMVINGQDVKTKGLLIGRNSQNLKSLTENMQRYYKDLKEIKVI